MILIAIAFVATANSGENEDENLTTSNLSFQQRSSQPILLSMLAIGDLRILHLPGEPMVEFQLFPQRYAPQQFVAVAGYGDCGTGYLCTKESYGQGGYEPSASLISPDGEAVLKSAIRQLLQET